jgi:hypothetical protein
LIRANIRFVKCVKKYKGEDMKNVLLTFFLVACGGVEVSEQATAPHADSDATTVVSPSVPVATPVSTPVTDVTTGVSDVAPATTTGSTTVTGTTTGATATTTTVTPVQ